MSEYEHPGEGPDDLYLLSEAALDAYARGDTEAGDEFMQRAHDLERGLVAQREQA